MCIVYACVCSASARVYSACACGSSVRAHASSVCMSHVFACASIAYAHARSACALASSVRARASSVCVSCVCAHASTVRARMRALLGPARPQEYVRLEHYMLKNVRAELMNTACTLLAPAPPSCVGGPVCPGASGHWACGDVHYILCASHAFASAVWNGGSAP